MSSIDTAALRLAQLKTRRRWIRWFVGGLIPGDVLEILHRLESADGEAYVVGGCVRDLILSRTPDDWDITTSLPPQAVMEVFPRNIPTGIDHGTVTVITSKRPVEITTFRTEGGYSDHRRPDWVAFSPNLKEDLARRDFTFNAMALDRSGRLVDGFEGLEDLAHRRVRTVGCPEERFQEDALRMVRAVRFACQLDFSIDPKVMKAIKEQSALLQRVSYERIRHEFDYILMSEDPARGVQLLLDAGLLEVFWPELAEGVDMVQNEHHAYAVWEHSLAALDAMAQLPEGDLSLRLAALLHDIAKSRSLSVDDETGDRHFYNHHVIGTAMAQRMLERLRYDKKTIKRVTHMVRHHMALHHYPDMKDSAIRRLISRVGVDNIHDLIQLRMADRAGSGTKDTPLSRGTLHLLRRIERVLQEDAAFGLKDLAVDGNDVMRITGLRSGPHVGEILEALFEEVLEDPTRNREECLEAYIRQWIQDRSNVSIEPDQAHEENDKE